MTDPWPIYLLIFASVALCVFIAQDGLRGIIERERREAKRFSALNLREGVSTSTKYLRRKNYQGPGSQWLDTLHLLMLQSGTRLTLTRLAFFMAIVWLAVFAALPLQTSVYVQFAATGLSAMALVYGYLSFKRAKRIALFAEQLPDVLDVIVRSLRAGHPLPVSLALVAREMPHPAGPEFTVVIEEINYGRGVNEALEMLVKRTGYNELRFLVSSIAVAQQTGGNLLEILSRLAKMLRDRFKLNRKIRALSAEGRISGYTLSALPIILFGIIWLVSPSYYEELWQSTSKWTIISVAGGLLIVGNAAIYKLINFKV